MILEILPIKLVFFLAPKFVCKIFENVAICLGKVINQFVKQLVVNRDREETLKQAQPSL